MKISVIITSFNNSQYIEQCIESVINQTRTPDEVVVIDDYSTDNSRELLKKYKKNYNFITLIFNKKNIGVAKSRDKAIHIAKGELITTLDGDDFYYASQKLEKEELLYKKKVKENNKNVITYSRTILVNNKGENINKTITKKFEEGDLFFSILTRKINIPRDFLFNKKSYFKIGGYDSSFPIYEDWDLKIRLASDANFYHSQINGTAYRQHSSGLSKKSFFSHLRWLFTIFNKNSYLLKNKKINTLKAYIIFIKSLFLNFLKK